jgi:SAM-dependent methyltransferase
VSQTPHPFDRLAPTYDADFTASPIARHLRGRVHARLDSRVMAGDHVLELGCGTGEDALHLARRGVHITATDSSDAMLTIARAKLSRYPDAHVEHLDIGTLGSQNSEPRTENREPLSLVFANFGVLNCLSNWRPLAAGLAQRLPPGGFAAFGVMAPLCLWEIGWHAQHGEWAVALRRMRKGGSQFTVDYPSIRRLTHDFTPWFHRVHVEPLGLFLPPSDVYGVIERRPRLLRTLIWFDDRVGRVSAFALLADHYWIEFERA